MKERPILFSAPMVRAILDGRKTQTRRVVKSDCLEIAERDDGTHWPWREDCDNGGDIWYPCPYGYAGDLLWVRETWHPETSDPDARAAYKADCDYDTSDCSWRPSIHMPRWASRILLRITDIRVERLQAIRDADALAEGIIEQTSQIDAGWQDYWPSEDGEPYASAREAYRALWESINGAGSWDANPWVWVVEFERVQP